MRKLILIALACYATAAISQIYTWKDSSGITHYSDQPPPGKKTPVKELPLPPAPPPSQAKETVPKETGMRDRQVDNKAENAKVTAPTKQEECEKAKSNLQAFENRPRRMAVGKGGKFHALDGEERAVEEAALRKAIAEACK